MAHGIIIADTSLLIDFFRKTDKRNSKLISLYDEGFDFCISAITHYELYSGATALQLPFWKRLLSDSRILPFDELVSQTAVELNEKLKLKRKQIGMADLFIAATAVAHTLPLATLNRKHFDRIEGLVIID